MVYKLPLSTLQSISFSLGPVSWGHRGWSSCLQPPLHFLCSPPLIRRTPQPMIKLWPTAASGQRKRGKPFIISKSFPDLFGWTRGFFFFEKKMLKRMRKKIVEVDCDWNPMGLQCMFKGDLLQMWLRWEIMQQLSQLKCCDLHFISYSWSSKMQKFICLMFCVIAIKCVLHGSCNWHNYTVQKSIITNSNWLIYVIMLHHCIYL